MSSNVSTMIKGQAHCEWAARQEAQTSMAEGVERAPLERSKAIVLGGSIAGLATAAAISQHFDEVIILERENCAGLEVWDGEFLVKSLINDLPNLFS